MKRGTSNHPKVYELAEALRVKRPAALGYLQLLWDFTAEYAPEGDIGRYSDSRIEAALDWGGVRGKLVAALVRSRWVDLDTNRRLVVHDWLDHAEKSVHRRLQRAAERNLRDPRKMTPEARVIDADLKAPVCTGAPPAVAFNHSHNQSQPDFASLAEKLYHSHPKKAGKIPFEQALAEVLSAAPDQAALAARIEQSHASWLPTWERDDGRYAPRLDRWIQSSGFLDDPPAATTPDSEYRGVEEFRREEFV